MKISQLQLAKLASQTILVGLWSSSMSVATAKSEVRSQKSEVGRSFAFQSSPSPTPHTLHPTLAQAILKVESSTALESGTEVLLFPGRTTVLDFSAVGEVITSIKLGDLSRTVYSTDVPMESGKASTIYLQQIKPLTFKGATTNLVPNLIVKTLSRNKDVKIYVFNLHSVVGNPSNNGVAIVPTTKKASTSTWTVKGRKAHLVDIERGLQLAIARHYTSAKDPIVAKIREFLALVENSGMSLMEAAQATGLDLAVISSLAEIGLEFRDDAFSKPVPTSPSPNQISEN